MSYLPVSSAEYENQKEEITNSIKANYEKVLQNERTLKTQVCSPIQSFNWI